MGEPGRFTGRKFLSFSASLVFAILAALTLALMSGGGQAAASAAYTAYTHQITITGTGGECASVGSWDQYQKSCTLNTDIADTTIWLTSSGVTLNGVGHSVSSGADVHFGVIIGDSTSGITVGSNHGPQYGVGIVLNGSGSTLTANTVSSNPGSGVVVNASSSGDTISGNTASSNSGHAYNDGFYFSNISGNVISGNTLASNGNNGIRIDGGSAGNSLLGNTISSNKGGGLFFGYPSEIEVPGTIVYHNNFIDNWVYQTANDGSGAVTLSFNLATPIGGNYWSDFSTPAQGCTDANGDGFCDSPYYHTAASPDNLPLTHPVAGGKPPLTLNLPSPSWASLSDYQAGILSVTWTVNNTGANEAWSVQLTGSSNTNGVTPASTLPAAVGTGNILPGSSGSVTLKYNVPAGVGSWVSSLSGSAQDGVETSYSYP